MTPRADVRIIAVAGTVLVSAYAGLAAVQILVLNPLAAAPGRTLGQIRGDLAVAGQSMNEPIVLGLLGLGVALALTVLVLASRRRDATPLGILSAYLMLLVAGAPVYWVASFGAGMSLADTYGIGGGDHSMWALPLYLTSLAALGVLIGVVIAVAVRDRRRTVAAVA